MICQQLPIQTLSIFMFFLVKFPKTNATPTPLKTQNKPIFSILRIALSNFILRTKDDRLRTAQSKNKPNQTQFACASNSILSIKFPCHSVISVVEIERVAKS